MTINNSPSIPTLSYVDLTLDLGPYAQLILLGTAPAKKPSVFKKLIINILAQNTNAKKVIVATRNKATT